MKIDEILHDGQWDLLRVNLTGSDGFTYGVHHIYEPSTVTDEWKGIWDVLENVYKAREDTEFGTFADWLARLESIVNHGRCILVYKYRGDLLVGLAILHESIALHYGKALSVFGIYNHEGDARGFYKIFKMICADQGFKVISRVKYIAPYRYMNIYTRV